MELLLGPLVSPRTCNSSQHLLLLLKCSSPFPVFSCPGTSGPLHHPQAALPRPGLFWAGLCKSSPGSSLVIPGWSLPCLGTVLGRVPWAVPTVTHGGALGGCSPLPCARAGGAWHRLPSWVLLDLPCPPPLHGAPWARLVCSLGFVSLPLQRSFVPKG